MDVTIEFDELQDGSLAIYSFTVGDTKIDCHGEDTAAVPKRLLNKVKLKQLDSRVWIVPSDRVSSEVVNISGPYQIRAIDASSAEVMFSETFHREEWDPPSDLDEYLKAKKEALEDRAESMDNVSHIHLEDDEEAPSLHFTAQFAGDTMCDIIARADKLADDIERATDISLGFSPSTGIDKCSDERDFTISVVIPLLRKLGFINIRYNHGKREYGKDITFCRLTEFDGYEHWAAQVKFGNIGGGARSDVDELIAQAQDAFSMPYYDIYAKDRVRISKMVIAISGRFTENATEKICEKIESHAVRNNLVFLDHDKIACLCERDRAL